ncbi:MAG: flagellar hook capping protein [Clostridia bacterium]|jgi:flagellar basal-body rod modification protein FlgD|nr:flagellar hook capping protein [Clostridia bacterium]
MAVNNISATYASQTIDNKSKSSDIADKRGLTMDDFFKLIAAQLQNQDMFNPVDNTEFIAQMAQISTLSQINELSNNINTNLSVSLLGKTVSASAPDERGINKTTTGIVEGVSFNNGTAVVQIGGQLFQLEQINQILSSAAGSSSDDEL